MSTIETFPLDGIRMSSTHTDYEAEISKCNGRRRLMDGSWVSIGSAKFHGSMVPKGIVCVLSH